MGRLLQHIGKLCATLVLGLAILIGSAGNARAQFPAYGGGGVAVGWGVGYAYPGWGYGGGAFGYPGYGFPGVGYGYGMGGYGMGGYGMGGYGMGGYGMGGSATAWAVTATAWAVTATAWAVTATAIPAWGTATATRASTEGDTCRPCMELD